MVRTGDGVTAGAGAGEALGDGDGSGAFVTAFAGVRAGDGVIDGACDGLWVAVTSGGPGGAVLRGSGVIFNVGTTAGAGVGFLPTKCAMIAPKSKPASTTTTISGRIGKPPPRVSSGGLRRRYSLIVQGRSGATS